MPTLPLSIEIRFPSHFTHCVLLFTQPRSSNNVRLSQSSSWIRSSEEVFPAPERMIVDGTCLTEVTTERRNPELISKEEAEHGTEEQRQGGEQNEEEQPALGYVAAIIIASTCLPSTGAAVSADVNSCTVEQVPETGSTVDWCRSLELFPEIVRKMDKKPLKICLKATTIQELPDSSIDLVGLLKLKVIKVLNSSPSSLFTLTNFVPLKVGGCPQLGGLFARFRESPPFNSC
ncbi:hypothetical protein PIB30_041594 [Stylosanthes scabra]|uniref:Disease resistance protein RPS4B/Roq1-like leucine-rich repeats domain-containing protein n=1 Tax=Stylosanthes scabra TaxID=79078 RepID=A0ABU6UHN0_9FABA|nr:hypothetical protein [Stylosanthes scabra]